MRREADLAAVTARLADLLEQVLAQREGLLARVVRLRPAAGSLQAYLRDELRWSAHELGLQGLDLGLDPLLADLCGQRP